MLFFFDDQGCMSDFNKFDLLWFWRKQITNFPILSKIAHDILIVPVHTVPSEQIFSVSGRVLDEWRVRLASDILEAFRCVHEWEHARTRAQQVEDDWL